MATWFADGKFSGYDPEFGWPSMEVYILNRFSAVPVDQKIPTRLQYNGTADVYPPSQAKWDAVIALASINFTAADITANIPSGSSKRVTTSMFIVPASSFAVGVIPTQSQILAAGSAVRVYRSSDGIRNTSGNSSAYVFGPRPNMLVPNTKYWALVMPVVIPSASSTPSVANDKPLAGAGNVPNTVGRVTSFWSNRTPAKPVIFSPSSSDPPRPPGHDGTFAFTVADPDQLLTGLPAHIASQKDVAGYQIQYSALPSATQPDPPWTDLPLTGSSGQWATHSWSIVGSSPDSLSYFPLHTTLINTQTAPLRYGTASQKENALQVPGGTWRIRVRVFDYGHPNSAWWPPLFRPLGSLSPDNYPATNASPWSDPVTVSTETQVPPPTPVAPINGVAVQVGTPFRFQWKYRNQAVPTPLPQKYQEVQIREVSGGAGDWVPVNADYDANPFFEVDPSLPSGNVLADPNITDAYPTSGDDWISNGASALVSSPPGRTDPWWLEGSGSVTSWSKTYLRDPADRTVLAGGWYYSPQAQDMALTLFAYTSVGGETPPPGSSSSDFTRLIRVVEGWNQLPSIAIPLNTDAHSVVWTLLSSDDDFPTIPGSGLDLMTLRAYPEGTSPLGIDLVSGNLYEWRVRVRDTEDEWSDWSAPSRFWAVPEPSSGDIMPVPPDSTDAATLGCGTYRVMVFRRGGEVPVGELTKFSRLKWGRLRDDLSLAEIILVDWTIDCGQLLASLEPWAYELVIFRDNGYGVDRVWEGPITLITYREDSVTIDAKDVMAYAYRRIVKLTMNDGKGSPYVDTTVVNRALRVLQNSFAEDDPNILSYLTVFENEDDAKQSRKLPAYSKTAFEELDDMAANAGLDYTAIGRTIVLWGTRSRIGTLPEFRDSDLGAAPIVSVYGMSMANRYAVSDGAGVWGEATRLDADGKDLFYGLVELLSSTWSSEADEEDYAEVNVAKVKERFEGYAAKSIASRYPAPVVVRIPDNTTLNPGVVLSIQHLIPGVVVPLRSFGTLRSVVANQKLDRVEVTVDSSGESIAITLSPFSYDDAIGEDTGGEG